MRPAPSDQAVKLINLDNHHREITVAPLNGESSLGGGWWEIEESPTRKRGSVALAVARLPCSLPDPFRSRKLGQGQDKGQKLNVSDALGNEVRGPGTLRLTRTSGSSSPEMTTMGRVLMREMRLLRIRSSKPYPSRRGMPISVITAWMVGPPLASASRPHHQPLP